MMADQEQLTRQGILMLLAIKDSDIRILTLERRVRPSARLLGDVARTGRLDIPA